MSFEVAAWAADLTLECGGRHDHVGEDAADSVTILRCANNRRATKRWMLGPDGEPILEGYDAGMRYATSSHPVASLAELVALLDRLAPAPHALVIRGEPRAGVIGTIGRRIQHDQTDGSSGRYDDVPRRWVAHDLDKVPLSRAYDVRHPLEARAAMEELRRTLSIEWRRAACYAQLTSSAGTGDPSRISARLWFWLDRPVGRAELEAWAKATLAPVDLAIYRAVQPHYTAAPVYEPPLTDPIPARAGMLDGDPVVWLREYAIPDPRPVERTTYTPRPPADSASAEYGRRYARATLESLAAELASAPEGDRHATVHAAARRAGGLIPGGWLTRSEVYDELTAAARAAGLGGAREHEVMRTIGDAIDTGAQRWAWDPPTSTRRAS